MQLAAKKTTKTARKTARKTAAMRKGKPAAASKSDAELARDLRSAAEAYNACLRQKKAASLMLERAITAAQAAGLDAEQEGGTYDTEVSFPSIIRPL